MKATLEFTLPEEHEEFDSASHGADWQNVVWEMDQALRGYLKHGHAFKEVDATLQFLRDTLWEHISDRGLKL